MPTVPTAQPKKSSSTLWIVIVLVAVCLVGSLYAYNQSQAEKEQAALRVRKQKEEQARARAEAQRRKVEEKRQEAERRKQAEEAAKAKAEEDARAKAEAEREAARQAAAAEEQATDAEESSESGESDKASGAGETDDEASTPDEELAGDAEITPGHKLTLLSPTDEDNALFFSMLATATKENDYLTLRDHLKTALDRAYPQLLDEDEDESGEAADDKAEAEEDAPKTTKQNGKGRKSADEAAAQNKGPQLPVPDKKAAPLAKSVYSVYLCLDMALMNPPQGEEPPAEEAGDEAEDTPKAAAKLSKQDAFCAWLVANKGKAANSFVQSLGRYKVTGRDEAVDLLDKLRDFHAAEPKKALKEIPAIVNPVAGKVSKKLYPRPDRKKIDEEIVKILKRKDKGNSKDEQEAVNLLNVYRYLCGVTPNVEHSAEFGEQARKAAAACHRNNGLSHALGDFTEVCNLAGGSQAAPTVSIYMDDFGSTNQERRGHRMWCLHAQLGKCGFGVHEQYTAMRVTDTSNPKPTTAAYSYPGRGFYPAEYMHGDGWSYFAPSGTDLGSEVKVEMWKLSGSLKAQPRRSQLSGSNAVTIKALFPNGHYVNFEPDYAGMMKKVKGKGKDKGKEVERLSGTYWIRVTGSDGKFVDEYVVEFY